LLQGANAEAAVSFRVLPDLMDRPSAGAFRYNGGALLKRDSRCRVVLE